MKTGITEDLNSNHCYDQLTFIPVLQKNGYGDLKSCLKLLIVMVMTQLPK